MRMVPPEPTYELDTVIAMLPEMPPVATPAATSTDPLGPAAVDPVLNNRDPLTPVDSAFADRTIKLPEEELVEAPDVTNTLPPTPVTPDPPDTLKPPPA